MSSINLKNEIPFHTEVYISSGACGCPSKMMKGVIPSLLFWATFFASSTLYKEEKQAKRTLSINVVSQLQHDKKQ